MRFAADSAVTQPGSGVIVSCSASWSPADRLHPFPACIYSCKFKVNMYMNFIISVAMAYNYCDAVIIVTYPCMPYQNNNCIPYFDATRSIYISWFIFWCGDYLRVAFIRGWRLLLWAVLASQCKQEQTLQEVHYPITPMFTEVQL